MFTGEAETTFVILTSKSSKCLHEKHKKLRLMFVDDEYSSILTTTVSELRVTLQWVQIIFQIHKL